MSYRVWWGWPGGSAFPSARCRLTPAAPGRKLVCVCGFPALLLSPGFAPVAARKWLRSRPEVTFGAPSRGRISFPSHRITQQHVPYCPPPNFKMLWHRERENQHLCSSSQGNLKSAKPHVIWCPVASPARPYPPGPRITLGPTFAAATSVPLRPLFPLLGPLPAGVCSSVPIPSALCPQQRRPPFLLYFPVTLATTDGPLRFCTLSPSSRVLGNSIRSGFPSFLKSAAGRNVAA